MGCKNCQFWSLPDPEIHNYTATGENASHLGTCSKIVEATKDTDVKRGAGIFVDVMDPQRLETAFVTGPDFNCALFVHKNYSIGGS